MKAIDVIDYYLIYVSNENFNEYADLMESHLHDIKDCYEEPVHQSIIVDFYRIYNKKKFMNSKLQSENIKAFNYTFTREDLDKMYEYYKMLLGI